MSLHCKIAKKPGILINNIGTRIKDLDPIVSLNWTQIRSTIGFSFCALDVWNPLELSCWCKLSVLFRKQQRWEVRARYLLAQICQYYEAMKRSNHVALSFLSQMHSVLRVSVRHLTAVSNALLLVPDNVGKMVFPGVILKDLMIVINEVQDLLDHVTLYFPVLRIFL